MKPQQDSFSSHINILTRLFVIDSLKYNVSNSLKTRYSMLNKRMKKVILAMF